MEELNGELKKFKKCGEKNAEKKIRRKIRIKNFVQKKTEKKRRPFFFYLELISFFSVQRCHWK